MSKSNKQIYDIIIIGASFSGLALAHHLPKKYKILILDKKSRLDAGVESTGLITSATYNLISEITNIDAFIPNKINNITVISPDYDKHFSSHTKDPWIYSTDTPKLLAHLSQQLPSNVELKLNCEFKNSEDLAEGVRVCYREKGVEKTVEAKFLVGADGTHSKVGKQNPKLSENKKFLAGLEKVFYGDINFGEHPQSTIYHFWFGEFSLGYGGWLSPTIINGQNAFRVGLAKLGEDVHKLKKLNDFIDILKEKQIIRIQPESKLIYAFGSLIPIGGVLKNIYNNKTVLLGDAAGFCGAFAADGIKGALVSAKVVANLLPRYLDGEKTAFDNYKGEVQKYQKLITYYRKQKLYRWGWDQMKSDRTFHAMYDIIAKDKEGFLYQFCDSKDNAKSLLRLVIKTENLFLLIKYAWYMGIDKVSKNKK